MPSRLFFAALLIATSIGVTARPSAQPAAQQSASTTTLDDQAELAVTVYNSDLALVRDVRNVQIARGTSDLQFMDIARPSTRRPSTSDRSPNRVA